MFLRIEFLVFHFLVPACFPCTDLGVFGLPGVAVGRRMVEISGDICA